MKTELALIASTFAAVSAFRVGPRSPSRTPTSLSAAADNALSVNSAVKVAADGMSLLKPLFTAEASLQAAVLGAFGSVDKEVVQNEIEMMKLQNKILIYTYGLSPFSTEAVSLLDQTGYDYRKVELGAEWFLLGAEGSETRVALSKEVESGATSLPKIFIDGECIGGYAELAELAKSGTLDSKLKAAVTKTKNGKSNFFNNLFA